MTRHGFFHLGKILPLTCTIFLYIHLQLPLCTDFKNMLGTLDETGGEIGVLMYRWEKNRATLM